MFNSAKNHQNLALLKINCFGTYVLALNSAEVQRCRRKIEEKLNFAENHQTLALLNSFFWQYYTPQQC